MDFPVNIALLSGGGANSSSSSSSAADNTSGTLDVTLATVSPVLLNAFITETTGLGTINLTGGGGDPNLHGHHAPSVLRYVTVAAQALVLLTIFLLSSLGNAAVLLVIIKHRQLRTVTNAFILSLSLSDLLAALLCLPVSFVTLFFREDDGGGAWMFGDHRFFCAASGFFNTCFGVASTLTMTLISLDRYCAIVRQPREKIGRRRAAQLLCAVWLCAVLFSLPWHLLLRTRGGGGGDLTRKPGFYHCAYAFAFHHAGASWSRLGAACGAGLVVTCFLLPFALMCFCHYSICRAVRRSETRVRPVTTYAHLLRFYGEMRTATTVLVMIVLMIACRGPYCLMALAAAVGGGGGETFHPAWAAAAVWLAWANGAVNPLIYAARNPNIAALLGGRRRGGEGGGYRAPTAQAYLSAQTRRRAEVRRRERYVSRTCSSPAAGGGGGGGGGQGAVWAWKSPAVFFCRDAWPDVAMTTEPLPPPKEETADTSL